MKKKLQNYDWVRLTIIVLLLLNLMLAVNQSAGAAPDTYDRSDKWLLTNAIAANNEGDGLLAAEYLRAFIEREPYQLENSSYQKEKYNNILKNIESKVYSQIRYGKKVQANLAKCGRYDCTNAHYSATNSANNNSIDIPLLPDQVIFFDGPNCTGYWSFAGVGTYNNTEEIHFRNNSINGVMVGSGLKVIMCPGYNMTGNCFIFTSNYCNLGQLSIGYDVSSVRVYER
jgi:hypothetical protein